MTTDLGRITQGERGTLTITWTFPDYLTSPATIQSAAITAVMRNVDTGAVTAVTGALTGTAATTFTWALSAADSGTAGSFAVVFRAVVSGIDTYTLEASLTVADNPAVDTVAGPALVGVPTDDAAWLAASEAGGPLGTAAYVATTAFDAAGTGAAAAALRVAKAGDTMTGLLQFSGTTHAGLKLASLTKAQRDALTPAAGMTIFNTDDDEAQYYDGAYWRQFSGTPALPITLDFTAMSDGALPAFVYADTWAISSGVATNTPRLSAEILTNPGLEGTYTAGLSPNLTKSGSPTVSESTADVHGGASAQVFTAAAFNDRLQWPNVTGIAGAWYLYTIWAKRTTSSGTNARFNAFQSASFPTTTQSIAITGAAWQQEKLSIISTTTNTIFAYPVSEVGSSAFDTVIVDDGSLKRITYGDLFAMIDGGDRTATVKAQPSPLADGALSGVVAWASGVSAPDTFLLAYWRFRSQKTGSRLA